MTEGQLLVKMQKRLLDRSEELSVKLKTLTMSSDEWVRVLYTQSGLLEASRLLEKVYLETDV